MLVLFLIGIVAGLIEASAGGSGLISLPTILYLGYQPLQAVATSKFQYAFGAVTAISQYTRAGLISWRALWPMIAISVVAGASGAYVISVLHNDIVSLLMPVLLLAMAMYFGFSPRVADKETEPRLSIRAFGLLVVPMIGFYDGFFGVGSASLYMAAFVFLMGMNVKTATANTKLVDFSSGVAALLVLAIQGHVLLKPGLALAAGQIVGSYIGASFVIRFGARWVKPVLVLVTIGLSIDLLLRRFL